MEKNEADQYVRRLELTEGIVASGHEDCADSVDAVATQQTTVKSLATSWVVAGSKQIVAPVATQGVLGTAGNNRR